jgi:hypothetical protein
MSAYLSNLAKTVTQPGGGVQPRLPGRFEPIARAVLEPVEATAPRGAPMVGQEGDSGRPTLRPADAPLPDPTQAETQRTSSRPAPTSRAASASPSPRLQTTAHAPEARPEVQPQLDVDESPARQFTNGPSSAASASAGQNEVRRGAPLLIDIPQPVQNSQSVRPEAHPVSQPDSLQPLLTERRRASLPQLDAAPVKAATGPRLEIEPAIPNIDRVDGEPLLTVTGSAGHLLPADDRQPESGAAAEARVQPPIRVHIGRIEIRGAPAAPAPRPAPPRRQPALSLDQYLQRRNGGGR